MKILAVGRNYQDHTKELNNPVPQNPVVFLKPDTALLTNNAPFYHPDFSNNIHYEAEMILRVCKQGKYIEEKFAYKYFDAVGLGIDFTARDVQQKLKDEGHPWEIAKSFNNSAPVSKFIEKKEFSDPDNINFSLYVNQEQKQKANTCNMIFSTSYLISYMSSFFMLKKGDIIFTGTPKGTGTVKPGDQLIGYIEDRKMLNFSVK